MDNDSIFAIACVVVMVLGELPKIYPMICGKQYEIFPFAITETPVVSKSSKLWLSAHLFFAIAAWLILLAKLLMPTNKLLLWNCNGCVLIFLATVVMNLDNLGNMSVVKARIINLSVSSILLISLILWTIDYYPRVFTYVGIVVLSLPSWMSFLVTNLCYFRWMCKKMKKEPTAPFTSQQELTTPPTSQQEPSVHPTFLLLH